MVDKDTPANPDSVEDNPWVEGVDDIGALASAVPVADAVWLDGESDNDPPAVATTVPEEAV